MLYNILDLVRLEHSVESLCINFNPAYMCSYYGV